MSTTTPALATAVACWANDIVTIPLAEGTSKRPALAWKQFQDERPTLEQVKTWFEHTEGIGVVTGEISRNLAMLELEGRVTAEQRDALAELATDTIPDLWQRLQATWIDASPSGGIHYYLRLELADGEAMPRNAKIAHDADRHVLAETRAGGGFAVIAPTPGHYHQTGQAWTPISGHPSNVQTFTIDELETLTAVIHAALDQTPEPAPATNVNSIWQNSGHPTTSADGDVKPGDDYEAKTDWTDILEPHGWTIAFTRGRERYWTRPGKTTGISATTGAAQDRERLYVFSSSTDFNTEEPYTKFGAYALLEHGGDHSAAARALAAKGFGHRAERTIAPAPAVPEPAALGEVGSPSATVTNITAARSNTALKALPATISSDPDALTDLGNARLTATRYAHRLRYIPDAGRWAEWTGTRWEWAPDHAPATQAVIETIEEIPVDNDQLIKHRNKSMGARAISNAVALLKAEPALRINADAFDTHAYELNTPGGIVNLRTGDLTPSNPTRYHSMTSPHTPADAAPKWTAFITWAMKDSAELTRYLQQLVGLSLIGETLEPILPFLYGKGANGKSVFLETLRSVLGDYAIQSPNDLLLVGPKQHPTELANLRGRRFVVMAEINEGARFDEAKLKQLTGGDAISARFMRQDLFDFTPTHTLWLAANHKPTVAAGGDSFWRRVRIIPFDNQVPKQDRNGNLMNELLEEAPGILQWAINGCIDYLNNGLIEPAEVANATAEYASEEDHLGRFMEDRVQRVSNAARVDQTEFRKAYKDWCLLNDEQELSATALGRALKTRFDIEGARSHGRRYYAGVILLNTGTDEDESEGSMWR